MALPIPANTRPAEWVAMILAAVFGIASVVGLWTKLGMTPDQVGELHALALLLAAGVRAAWQAKGLPA